MLRVNHGGALGLSLVKESHTALIMPGGNGERLPYVALAAAIAKSCKCDARARRSGLTRPSAARCDVDGGGGGRGRNGLLRAVCFGYSQLDVVHMEEDASHHHHHHHPSSPKPHGDCVLSRRRSPCPELLPAGQPPCVICIALRDPSPRPPAPWPVAHCRLSRSRALKSEKDLKLLLNVHSNSSKDRRDKVAITVPVPNPRCCSRIHLLQLLRRRHMVASCWV